LVEAEGAYRRALAKDRSVGLQAQAFKGLGYLYSDSTARQCDAKTAFGRYLEMLPGAPDAAEVRTAIGRLSC
jgi:hypothetical protein